jgi:hypothetical protein
MIVLYVDVSLPDPARFSKIVTARKVFVSSGGHIDGREHEHSRSREACGRGERP